MDMEINIDTDIKSQSLSQDSPLPTKEKKSTYNTFKTKNVTRILIDLIGRNAPHKAEEACVLCKYTWA